MNQKIYIIDDHEIFSKGLQFTIQTNNLCDEVKIFSNEEDFYSETIFEKPSMIIVDHILEKTTGIELIFRIKSVHKTVKSLLISSIQDEQIKSVCIENGINGYIYKSELENSIILAIQCILKGGIYYSGSQNINWNERSHHNKINPFSKLTNRELEIVRYTIKGFPCKKIANILEISDRTVQRHYENIYEKLGKQSTVQLARKAYLWGIIKEEDLKQWDY